MIRIGCGTLFVIIVLVLIILSFLGRGCSFGADYIKATPEQMKCLENWDKWELRLDMPYKWGGKPDYLGKPADCSGFERKKFMN